MATTFSRETLVKFEAAAASIPMRQLDRAFAGADIRLGNDPGGPDGTRRVQFRRYVATIDQKKAGDVLRLGLVLGALIGEVADSKQEYLVSAAEGDGFVFTGGAFRPAASGSGARSAALDDAREQVDRVCRSVLKSLGKPVPKKADGLSKLLEATRAALDPGP